MFTGLIQDVGVIERVIPGGTTDLWIRTALGASTFELGESIAVNGTCLTVVERHSDRFRVQAAEETLRRTTLGDLGPNAPVNLERALRVGDRLGGHMVQGHVDGVTTLEAKRPEGSSVVMRFALSGALAPWFIEKGSVAIDGVSLTVMTLADDAFEVMLIPETQARTTLGRLAPGAKVNIEADVIGKYVARLYALGKGEGAKSGVSLELLKAAGFSRGTE